MSNKLIKIQLPGDFSRAMVKAIFVRVGDRVRAGDALVELTLDYGSFTSTASHSGWVRDIAVRVNHEVKSRDVLVVLEIIDIAAYQIDEKEVNPDTELGVNGRRALEREGQRQFADGYSAELFEAPARTGEHGFNRIKQNPLTANMKEGVPPKMNANAASNEPGLDKLQEDAQNDPELQAKLSAELKQQLNITPGPSTSPTLKAG